MIMEEEMTMVVEEEMTMVVEEEMTMAVEEEMTMAVEEEIMAVEVEVIEIIFNIHKLVNELKYIKIMNFYNIDSYFKKIQNIY